MSKIKPKCLTIPADVREKLSDASTSKIDKIQLAEQIREQYGQSRAEMIRLTGIGNSEYSRGQKILKIGNAELIERLRTNNVSLCVAIDELLNPNYRQYQLRPNITDKTEILHEDTRTLLYRENGKAYLRLCWRNRGKTSWIVKEKIYTLDNASYGIGTAMELLKNGYTIHSNLRITKENQFYTTLKHCIVASFMGVPVEEIADEKIGFMKTREGINKTDIRIENLKCDVIPFLKRDFSISRRGKDIVIICHKNGNVYYTDDDCALYELLNDAQTKFHIKGRDLRLAVRLPNGRYEYLYHLIMAESLYGHPTDQDGFAEIMEDFRHNYIESGMEVDHLDGDIANNHLANLLLISGANNKRKSSLYQKIKLPYFCLCEKHDSTSIKMRCGYYAATKKPVCMVEGVYTMEEAINELQGFVDYIDFERTATTED